MRFLATLTATMSGIGPVLAQGFPGAKADVVSTANSASGSGSALGPFLNVMLALGIVYAVIRYGMPKALSRLNKRLVPGLGSDIRIEESASFAGGSLYVVSAREKTLLLSVSTHGVQCLADLTPAQAPAPAPTFSDLVEEQMRQEKPIPSEGSGAGVSEALRRLERLAS